MRTLQYLKKKYFFAPEKTKKPPSKVAHFLFHRYISLHKFYVMTLAAAAAAAAPADQSIVYKSRGDLIFMKPNLIFGVVLARPHY